MKPIVVLCGTFPSVAEEKLSQEAMIKRVPIDRNELLLAISEANGLILRNMPYHALC
ncbi:MAG: hypothetical protein LASZOEIN_000912 [Candidatus Fervidibacter sp.]